MSLLKSIVFGFCIGTAGLLLIEMHATHALNNVPIDKKLAPLLLNMASYTALSYCYFHFINMGETARRIRILRELNGSVEGLSIEEILRAYGSKEIVTRRLSRLIKNGQIEYREGRYFINKPLMLFASRVMVLLKRIVLKKGSEFD